MDENNSGALPPTEPNQPTPPEPTPAPAPEIPVVDNTQPAPEESASPAPEATSASFETAPATAPTDPDAPVSETSANESATSVDSTSDPASASAPESESSSSNGAPVLSGTPRSLGGTPSGSAEAGGPAAFGSASITSKPKSKALPVLLALVLILGLGGAAAAFYFLKKPTQKDTPDISADETPVQESETASRYALKDNSLSDFDLAFLRLEGDGEHASENKIYSPLSIKYALAMLADASAGDTKTQITNLIGDYAPKAYLNSSNRSLANAMFINTSFADQVKSTYTSALTEKYNAEVRLDPFTTPDNLNTWVSDKTLGIITNMFDESTVNPQLNFMLINALAIDMAWNNQLQCVASTEPNDVPCKVYDVAYAHENYSHYVSRTNFASATFNGASDVEAAAIGVSANRYDIISDLGEDHIRATARADYEKWVNDNLESAKSRSDLSEAQKADAEANAADQLAKADSIIDTYIEDLKGNYGKFSDSTDFAFADNETEKIFAKDLQEYDGVTLEYVGIMPKSTSVKSYLSSTPASALAGKLANLTTPSLDSFKEGVVTKISGTIPFFKFNYDLNLLEDLQNLGITDVFDTSKADLSEMMEIPEETLAGENRPYINVAAHSADIDFSNNGIKAAAVTAVGGLGSARDFWDYKWDVPVEEIDLTFDQPFFFLIRDKASGEVWFTGEVNALSAAS